MSVKIKYKLASIHFQTFKAFEYTAGKTTCASFKEGRRNVLNKSEECVSKSNNVPVQGAINKQALEGLKRNDRTSGAATGWK